MGGEKIRQGPAKAGHYFRTLLQDAEFVVVRERRVLQRIEQLAQLFVQRMPQIRLKTRKIVELDDGGEWKVRNAKPLVRSAVRDTRADAKAPHGGNAGCRRAERVEHFVAALAGQAGFRTEEHDVDDHL